MPLLSQPNVRPRPYSARTPSHRRHDPDLPVGGVHFRTGEIVRDDYGYRTQRARGAFRIPYTARTRRHEPDLPVGGDHSRTGESARTEAHVASDRRPPADAVRVNQQMRKTYLPRPDVGQIELKQKYEMPVTGWRSVAALHNAKSILYREHYKTRMEQMANELEIEGGLQNYMIPLKDLVKPYILGMVSVADKEKTAAEQNQGTLERVQGAIACMQKMAVQRGLDVRLVTSVAGFRELLLNDWRHIKIFVFDTTAGDFDAWDDCVHVVVKHRREQVRTKPVILILGTEDSMSEKQRSIWEEHHRAHQWQKVIKPVFLKQFSTMFDRALASHEDHSKAMQEAEKAKTKTDVACRAKRPLVFFTLHDEPHPLPDFEQDIDDYTGGRTLKQKDEIFERIIAASTRDLRPSQHRSRDSAQKGGTREDQMERGDSPTERGSVSSVSGRKSPRSPRVRHAMSKAETLNLVKAHPIVEKKLDATQNFTHVQREFKVKHRSEIVADTDGSIAYVMMCSKMAVPPLAAFVEQMNDEFVFIRHMPVGPRGGKAIGTSLSVNMLPVDVDLGFCEIGSDGACALAEGINKTGFYKSLDLTGNRIGGIGISAIASSLIQRVHMSHLTRLMLGSNQLADGGAAVVGKILSTCLNLEYVDLSCNKICTEGANAIGRALEQHASTNNSYSPSRVPPSQPPNGPGKSASIPPGGFNDCSPSHPARPLVGGLSTSTSLPKGGAKTARQVGGVLHLNLSNNHLGDQGTCALCSGLVKNNRLQTLILAHNEIKNDGAKSISDALIYNDAMTNLDISHNQITGIGGLYLSERIRLDRKTSFLDVSYNPLSAKAVVEIVKEARKQESIRLLNMWNTLVDKPTSSRVVADHTFDTAADLEAFIKEIKESIQQIKTDASMHEEQIHNARLMASRMKANPETMGSSELSDLQTDVSDITVTLAMAKTETLQSEQLLEAAEAALDDWLHDDSASQEIDNAKELMTVLSTLNLVEGRYELSLGDPWHYFVFLHVLQAQPDALGMVLQIEYMKKGWTVPYLLTGCPEHVLCDTFSQPFFYKDHLSHLSPRLDLDKVPQGGLAILTISYVANTIVHHYKLDLACQKDAELLKTIRARETWFRASERCENVLYEGKMLDCFTHAKWRVPVEGVVTLTHRMLQLDYHPADVFGAITFDLAIPWERIIACSLYAKVRARALRRLQLINARHLPISQTAAGNPVHKSSLMKQPSFVRKVIAEDQEMVRPVDELPDWEGSVMLDGIPVPFDNMVDVPHTGKLVIEVTHHCYEPRYSQAVVLQMHISVHRWIAERFWLRCFGADVADHKLRPSGDRRGETIHKKEFILEYPTFNNLEYQGMHRHAERLRLDAQAEALRTSPPEKQRVQEARNEKQKLEDSRWRVPMGSSEEAATLHFVYVLQDRNYVELQQQTWDLENEEERVDADYLFTREESFSMNEVRRMPKDLTARQQTSSAQPLAMPARLEHRALWRLPKTGLIMAKRARLLKNQGNKPSSQAVSALISALEQARKIQQKTYALSHLRELLSTQPNLRFLVAEQAVKVLEQIFADDEALMIQAATLLYEVSPEPQRFLLLLADHTAPSLSGNVVSRNTKLFHGKSFAMLH